MLGVGRKTREGKPMKFIRARKIAALLSSWLTAPSVFAQGAGIE